MVGEALCVLDGLGSSCVNALFKNQLWHESNTLLGRSLKVQMN